MSESNLVSFARQELKLAGMYDEDADYGPGAIADHVLSLIALFSSGGHSGGSAMLTLELFNSLARFKPLSPLTTDPDEWMEVGISDPDGSKFWQSRRNPEVFSDDGGKTAYECGNKSKIVKLLEKNTNQNKAQ